jgi:hypothetical protein
MPILKANLHPLTPLACFAKNDVPAYEHQLSIPYVDEHIGKQGGNKNSK